MRNHLNPSGPNDNLAKEGTYLKELNEEGYKLIRWSNELKNQLLNANNYNKNNSSNTLRNNNLNLRSGNNLESRTLLDSDKLAANGIVPENALTQGKVENNNFLLILYNNYKYLLKKYEELNEQKMSYVEGLREYQHKLDNSNHVIQLLKKQLFQASSSKSAQQSPGENLSAGSFKLNEVRNSEFGDEKTSLEGTDRTAAEKGSPGPSQEEALLQKLREKEEELSEKNKLIETLSLEVAEKAKFEAEYLRYKSLYESSLLTSPDGSLSNDNSLGNNSSLNNTNSLNSEDNTNNNDKSNSNNLSTDSSDKENSSKDSYVNSGNDEKNKVEEESGDGLKNLESLKNLDNEVLNSIHIQNMNNNGSMHIFKKGLLKKNRLKSCQIFVDEYSLKLFVKSRIVSELPLKEIVKKEIGLRTQSHKLFSSLNCFKTEDSDQEKRFVTLYFANDKVLNLYFEEAGSGEVWFNALTHLLDNLFGKKDENPKTETAQENPRGDAEKSQQLDALINDPQVLEAKRRSKRAYIAELKTMGVPNFYYETLKKAILNYF